MADPEEESAPTEDEEEAEGGADEQEDKSKGDEGAEQKEGVEGPSEGAGEGGKKKEDKKADKGEEDEEEEEEEEEEMVEGAEAGEGEGGEEEEEHEETVVLSGFDALRHHYDEVVESYLEMEEEDDHLLGEYKRMFVETETYDERVKQMQQDIQFLEVKIEEQTTQLFTAAQEAEELKDCIQTQLNEKEELKRQLDASHDRERALQEISETMRHQIEQLNNQIQQIYKMSKDSEDDPSSKKKNALQRDIERLENEVTMLTDRLKLANAIKDEMDGRLGIATAQVKELTQTIDLQNQFLLKEQQAKDSAEQDLKNANTTIKQKADTIDGLQQELKGLYDNFHRTERENRDLQRLIERYDTDLENVRLTNLKLSENIAAQKQSIKMLRTTINQQKEKLLAEKASYKKMFEDKERIQKAREVSDKRVHYLELKQGQQESEKTKLMRDVEHFKSEMQKMKHDREEAIQNLDVVSKNRDSLKKSVSHLQSQNNSLEKRLQMVISNKSKIEAELDELIQNHNKVTQKLSSTEKERDRYSATILDLTDKLEDSSDAIKDKLANIYELKKSIYELTTKMRMQQNVFEVIRGERNTFEKLLIQSQDTSEELKGKVRLINSQVDQLKEQIALKEAELIKQEKALAKMKKEKEELKIDLQKSQDELRKRKEEIKQLMKDKKNILRMNTILENEKNKQAVQIHHIMNERDILGTQLVRRNDEIALVYEKIKVMQDSFRKGEIQYNERLEDIRLLKLEVKRLVHEKDLLAKHIQSTIDNRTAVLDLERNVVKASLKVRALEEELSNPLNIHRWRKLEGEDPEKLLVIHKLTALQKRMVKFGYAALKREEQMQEMLRVYNELQQALINAPSSETIVCLTATQRSLRKRGKQMKCLVSELNMYQYQLSETQFKLKKAEEELHETKSEMFKLKLENDRHKLESREKAKQAAEPEGGKRILGGGFNTAVVSPHYDRNT